MLVDSHCHLDFPDFADDLDGVIARAQAVGVSHMLSISTRVRQFDTVAALAARYPNVFCTIGTHPHQAEEEPDVTAEQLIAIAQANPKCIGIGEVGLDYHYKPEAAHAQKNSFRAHIMAARQMGLPLIIHARDADKDMEALLVEEMRQGAFKAILHCFASGRRLAEVGLELGFCISFSGIVTFKNAPVIQDVAKLTPDDRLLVETDAPYLAPPPHRGKRNEPAFVRHTAEFVAKLRGQSFENVAEATTRNFFTLFTKANAS